jgi:hypothetical protein
VSAVFAGSMEFVIFGMTLLGVALFHRRALTVALAGLMLTIFVRVIGAPAGVDAGAYETVIHLASEWVMLANLFLLLLGFAVLANQFEQSNLPEVIPSGLPDGWLVGVAGMLSNKADISPSPKTLRGEGVGSWSTGISDARATRTTRNVAPLVASIRTREKWVSKGCPMDTQRTAPTRYRRVRELNQCLRLAVKPLDCPSAHISHSKTRLQVEKSIFRHAKDAIELRIPPQADSEGWA